MKPLNPTLYTIDLNCSICGIKTGDHILSSEFGWTKETATFESLGVADVRCDACLTLYGNFKDLVEQVKEVIPDPIEAENFVKLHRKNETIEAELIKANLIEDNSLPDIEAVV